MVVIPGLTRPLAAVGKRIDGWQDEEDRFSVVTKSSVTSAHCPQCTHRSRRVHGQYRRQLADQSCFGVPVTISVEIRRFKCSNAGCKLRTFAEPVDDLAARRQRRTKRLNGVLRRLGYALGGAAAGRLAAHLGIGVSADTLLRELRRAGGPAPTTPPIIVGIDDWAIARGHRYGTIIVDLQTRQPIDILDGRDSTIVAGWLRQHPTVRLVARDRAGAYSDAVHTVDASIEQVADRWHLLANMREAVEHLLIRQGAKLREAAKALSESIRIEGQAVTANTHRKVLPLNAWQRLGVERRAVRLARYEEVVRRRGLGESFKHIGLAMDIDQRIVSKFAGAGSFPERAPRARGSTLLDNHRQHVALRVAEGCVSPPHVWRELQSGGFTGSLGTVRSAMARDRAAAAETALQPGSHGFRCPSPRRAYAWVVGWQGRHTCERKQSDHQRFVDALCRIEPSISVGASLARNFLGLIHRRDLAGFDRWLDRAINCSVPEMRRFAESLRVDSAAVRAAFSSPWSSGQVEGQVNRLKFLKRQMYGRASLELLRLRVLHPN